MDKNLNTSKVEVGQQMHEMCSMVEEIAQMSKTIETQIAFKKPEIESATLNIANLQRKLDEQCRKTESDIA
jgi:hypothetical protein